MNSFFRAIFNNTFNFILAPLRNLFGFLRRAIPGLKWFANLKPEVLAAVLTFIFLLLIWGFTRFGPGAAHAQASTQMVGWAVTLVVIFAIPIVLYFFLRVLLQPPKSPYPDIDESWQVGLKELEKNGLVLKDLPIYLVLGMRDTKQIRSFIESSGREFDIEGVTGSGQTLIWYASKDQAFVFLANVGNFTEFSANSQKLRTIQGVAEQEFTSTAHISDFYHVPKQVMLDESEIDEAPIMGTVRATDAMPQSRQHASPEPFRPDSGEAGAPQEKDSQRQTARAKVSEQRKRLSHLATLIRRSRNPVCPINGILVNASVSILESYPEELSRQLRDDLSGIATELGVVCAVTLVVSGLETDKGFVNFAERLIQQNGPGFGKSKFGRSYRSWSPPTPEQLEQVAQAAVEEFDHFTHLLFTKRDALSREHVQGNRDLSLFLCRIYSTVLPGLKIVLGKGCNTPAGGDGEFPRFAGCYFVGNDQGRDFFLEKIFDRVDENQGELEWTRSTMQKEETWKTMANLSYLIGLISLIAFVFLLFYFRNPPS